MNPDKIRNILNILFLIGAVVSLIVYWMAKTGKVEMKVFLYVCGAAIFVKMMEFFIRFTNR